MEEQKGVVWQKDATVTITLTGQQFQELQILSNILSGIVDTAVSKHLESGVFKTYTEKDIIQTEKGNTLRPDFWTQNNQNDSTGSTDSAKQD